MASKKQRRRREKELRHEWEEVYVDAEGRELEPDEVDELLPRTARPKANGKAVAHAGAAKPKAAARSGRPMREMKPPSWRRVLKRGAIFAPLMYVFIALTSSDTSPLVNLAITAQLMLIFLPFSYLMDSFTYRLWKKRQARAT